MLGVLSYWKLFSLSVPLFWSCCPTTSKSDPTCHFQSKGWSRTRFFDSGRCQPDLFYHLSYSLGWTAQPIQSLDLCLNFLWTSSWVQFSSRSTSHTFLWSCYQDHIAICSLDWFYDSHCGQTVPHCLNWFDPLSNYLKLRRIFRIFCSYFGNLRIATKISAAK